MNVVRYTSSMQIKDFPKPIQDTIRRSLTTTLRYRNPDLSLPELRGMVDKRMSMRLQDQRDIIDTGRPLRIANGREC